MVHAEKLVENNIGSEMEVTSCSKDKGGKNDKPRVNAKFTVMMAELQLNSS